MAQKQHNCEQCPMRAKYDQNPKSFGARVWRWHINFCPGWKGFMNTLSEEEKEAMRQKYDFHKY